MRVIRLFVLVAAVCLSANLQALAEDMLTPVVASAMKPSTIAFRGTDNKLHLVYELEITNTGSATATLQGVDVVNAADSKEVLASFEGAALLSRLRYAGRGDAITAAKVGFSETRLLLIDIALDGDARPPATLEHRFHLLASGPPGSPKDLAVEQTYTIAPIAISTDVMVLGPPLAGKGWVALNGCCVAGGVHRGSGQPVNGVMQYAQRFAIDWMLLGANASLFRGDGKGVKDYFGYGATVIAVADGTVVDALSTLGDQLPGDLPDPKTITIENVDGNHIVLDLGQGRYGFYAHLQKNSLLVHKGDHVKRGQALALLGNTGNTSAPHLHFHLMDGTSVLGSSGLPYVIDHFEVAGQLSAAQFDAGGLAGEWSKGLLANPSSRKSEFPVDLTVVDF
jgi:murein DD-endopeptidase MepM/ murein hydrolase activator NlpD